MCKSLHFQARIEKFSKYFITYPPIQVVRNQNYKNFAKTPKENYSLALTFCNNNDKILACEQALLFGQAKWAPAPRGFAARSRVLPRLPPCTRPNMTACSEATKYQFLRCDATAAWGLSRRCYRFCCNDGHFKSVFDDQVTLKTKLMTWWLLCKGLKVVYIFECLLYKKSYPSIINHIFRDFHTTYLHPHQTQMSHRLCYHEHLHIYQENAQQGWKYMSFSYKYNINREQFYSR